MLQVCEGHKSRGSKEGKDERNEAMWVKGVLYASKKCISYLSNQTELLPSITRHITLSRLVEHLFVLVPCRSRESVLSKLVQFPD